jgi:hypothetical protein
MKILAIILLVAAVLGIAPSASANSISYSRDVRSMSSFSNSSFKDALKGLGLYEGAHLKGGEKITVAKIETLAAEGKSDVAIERWTLSRGGVTVAYYVKITHDGKAAPLFNISLDKGQDERSQPMLPAPGNK